MSSVHAGIPKEQQTAYQRWEMADISDDADMGTHFSNRKKKEDSAASAKIAQVFEQFRKEGFAKGMQEGFAIGMAKAREQAQQDQQQFAMLATNFKQALSVADEKVEENLLALALDIAKAMIKEKLSIDSQVILPVVREAMHYLPQVEAPARIICHHEDARILREYLNEELSEQGWMIQEDNNVERGGCLVETGTNQIDATNAIRWKRISDALAQSNEWLIA